MWARFLADYGIIFVLLILCAYFSVATIEEQHPTGAAAATELLPEIVSQTQPGATVLIVGRNTPEDGEFATMLAQALRTEGRIVVGTVRGQPDELYQGMSQYKDKGRHPDVIATVNAGGVGPILDNFRDKDKHAFEGTRFLIPRSYLWPNFLKASNFLNIINQIAVIAIIAIGMTMVIITGGIDLSVGSLMALSAVITAVLIRDLMGGYEASTAGLWAACLIAMAICGAIGFTTGVLVTRFEVPPFIATLAMMLIASGLALKLSNSESIDQIPRPFMWLGAGADLAGIPNAVTLMVFLYLVAHVVMSQTIYGRYIYAVGGNSEAARLSGVPIFRVIVSVYVLTGILAGLGGVIFASLYKSSNPNYGFMYELYVIAAVVVGGTSLSGGEGKILGTLLGAFLIAVIQNGMNLTGLRSDNQRIVLGLVILSAVLIDKVKKHGWVLIRKAG